MVKDKVTRVLIIESDDEDIQLIERCLGETGGNRYETISAKRIGEGLKALVQYSFDIVLTDLYLTDSQGIDTIKSVNRFVKSIPVIILTDVEDNQVAIEALKYGAQDLIHKSALSPYILDKTIQFSIERFQGIKELENTSNALRESQARLNIAQKIVQLGYWELNTVTRQMTWSDEMHDILKKPKDQNKISLYNFLDMVHWQDKEMISKAFKHAITDKTNFNLDHRLILDNEQTIYLNTQINPSDNAEDYLVGTIQDITARKEIEKMLVDSEEKYRRLFSDSRDGIYITSSDGYFLDFNPATEAMFGYSRDELLKTKVGSLYAHAEDRKRIAELLQKDQYISDYELQIRHKSGKVVDCLVSSNLRKSDDGKIIGYQGIIRDITEQKRTNQLIKAKEIAENSAQVKAQFLANMSHEIRTPLNGIYGITNLLLKTPVTQEQNEYLSTLRSSAKHLMEMINEILDFTKIESGKMEVNVVPINLNSEISDIINTLKPKVSDKGLQISNFIHPEVPDVVRIDNIKLNQILFNLLGNAIKFTEVGRVHLEIEQLESQDDQVVLQFSIVDTGIGIPEDKLEYIFDSFSQIKINDYSTHKNPGTGLGLTITKELVTLLDGQLSVTSSVGKGSTFRFTVKADKVQSETPKATRKEDTVDPSHIPLSKALIVEDNKVNQLVTKQVLIKWFPDVQVDIANNGEEAVKFVRGNVYDLIFMDIQMPIMDGIEATKVIRNELPMPINKTPILALTAIAIKGEVEKFIEIGMNDYISKPFEPDMLLTKISLILTGREPDLSVKQEPDIIIEESNGIDDTVSIDLNYLNSIAKNDANLRQTLIRLLIEETPNELKKLEESASKQDWSGVHAVAHKLKSSIVFLGVDDISESMKRISSNAKTGSNTGEILTDIEQVCKLTEIALVQLKNEVDVAV